MSVTEVKLKRLDDLEAEEVLLEDGESFLGKYFISNNNSLLIKKVKHFEKYEIQFNDSF